MLNPFVCLGVFGNRSGRFSWVPAHHLCDLPQRTRTRAENCQTVALSLRRNSSDPISTPASRSLAKALRPSSEDCSATQAERAWHHRRYQPLAWPWQASDPLVQPARSLHIWPSNPQKPAPCGHCPQTVLPHPQHQTKRQPAWPDGFASTGNRSMQPLRPQRRSPQN